ncbi:hypothetical protein MML48_2g00014472 [Holotrichia oblita]|uniref:Uncharacterized protein n=1 Tax=Holotrichia oblita TaxID=644536 RepID=A0ACB9TLZ6_HOLOL|nr:hypothetical protein MML48_2g00014472 [Holotrichia oblita]
MNNSGSLSRAGSRRSNASSSSKVSYSSPVNSPVPAPKSPTVYYSQRGHKDVYQKAPSSPSISHSSQKSPSYNKSPTQTERFNFSSGSKSPSFQLNSPKGNEFDFSSDSKSSYQKSPNATPKSPRSPRNINYQDETPASPSVYSEAHSPSSNYFNFNLQSPPKNKVKPSKLYHRQQYQASKTDSSSSVKSSLEYKSTKKHPDLDYQDIEYKVCNSLDSDSQHSSDLPSSVGYTSSYDTDTRRRSKHSSIKEKKPRKPLATLEQIPVMMTIDDATTTTITSLSRPSSPRRKSSVKGGLAYLASRRGSRDSVASNMSNVSNEDIGPLNFQNTVRGRQRRTSNFLELPGKLYVILTLLRCILYEYMKPIDYQLLYSSLDKFTCKSTSTNLLKRVDQSGGNLLNTAFLNLPELQEQLSQVMRENGEDPDNHVFEVDGGTNELQKVLKEVAENSRSLKEEMVENSSSLKEEMVKNSRSLKEDVGSLKEEMVENSRSLKEDVGSLKEEIAENSRRLKEEMVSFKEEIGENLKKEMLENSRILKEEIDQKLLENSGNIEQLSKELDERIKGIEIRLKGGR